MEQGIAVLPGDNRRPADIALGWLLGLNLKPGDVIASVDLDKAMCLPDPNGFQGYAYQKWALMRMSVLFEVRDRFETLTGEVLEADGRGRFIVLNHEEVADALWHSAYARILRFLTKTKRRLNRASKTDVSHAELTRRNDAVSKAASIHSFMRREQRKSLSV